MKVFSSLKTKTVNAGKHLFGYSQISQGLRQPTHIAKEMFDENMHEVTSNADSFSIPTETVLQAQKSFKRLLIVFVGLFIFAILYCIANLLHQNWIIALLALAFALLCLSLSFRYHFWLYQIKKRTLGLHFADYYKDEIETHLKSQTDKDKNKKGKPS